jgi:hypothetical protein
LNKEVELVQLTENKFKEGSKSGKGGKDWKDEEEMRKAAEQRRLDDMFIAEMNNKYMKNFDFKEEGVGSFVNEVSMTFDGDLSQTKFF